MPAASGAEIPAAERRERELLSAADVSRTVARMAHQIIEKTALSVVTAGEVMLLGIPTRGAHLARRLAGLIVEFADALPKTSSGKIKRAALRAA